MNKEFRIWGGQKFLYAREKAYIDSAYNSLIFWIEDETVWGDEEEITIHQWTSALDKNNNKIFEGDIVLFDNPDPYDGQDRLTKIVGYNPRAMGFRLYNFTHEINKYGGEAFFPEDVEVIGNIFEGAVKDGVDYGEYLKAKL